MRAAAIRVSRPVGPDGCGPVTADGKRNHLVKNSMHEKAPRTVTVLVLLVRPPGQAIVRLRLSLPVSLSIAASVNEV
jgi:hypothetical protein